LEGLKGDDSDVGATNERKEKVIPGTGRRRETSVVCLDSFTVAVVENFYLISERRVNLNSEHVNGLA